MNSKRQEVLQQAYNLLARREHSRAELFNKLFNICADKELVQDILDTLRCEGLQSDARFTESFVHHRVNKGQGSLKIDHALRQQGIAQDLIETFLEGAKIDWFTLAKDVRIKKYGPNPPVDYQNKAKQSRFLYSRGFSSDIINKLLR